MLTFTQATRRDARCMAATMIPDAELIAKADVVTVWVASPDAPTDMWSLSEAMAWVMRQPNRARISLFRPPGEGLRAAWVEFAQIERLAFSLAAEPSSDAA
nr:hypothetical protein [Nitrosomonas nitrosa]